MPVQSYGSVKVFWPDFDQHQLSERLRTAAQKLAQTLPVRQIYLIGSWARNQATAFSDIDLLVIYAGPPRPDVHRLVRQAIPLPGLEVHAYTEDELHQLAPTIHRMMHPSIRLL